MSKSYRKTFTKRFCVSLLLFLIVAGGTIFNPWSSAEATITHAEAPASRSEREPANQEVTNDDQENAPTGSWHESTSTHNIADNLIIHHGEKIRLYNFGDVTAVGANSVSNVFSTAETEYGFILSVIDEDRVSVEFYNYGDTDVVPVKTVIEGYEQDVVEDTGMEYFSIRGYSDNPDGYGRVTMTLSNGTIIYAGVFKENGRLYGVNITESPIEAESVIEFRSTMKGILSEYQITPDSTSLDINYPIVPLNDKECTDIQYWVEKSFEITKPEWTDAHKVSAIYTYVVENFAYHYWVLQHKTDTGKKTTSRYALNKSWTSTKDYPSTTKLGVCNDFAEIIGIMCRAQGIAATTLRSSTINHAWNYVYIKDYDRWISIDATPAIKYSCYSEDPAERELANSDNARYRCYDMPRSDAYDETDMTAVSGNKSDMESQGMSIIGT